MQLRAEVWQSSGTLQLFETACVVCCFACLGVWVNRIVLSVAFKMLPGVILIHLSKQPSSDV